MTENEEKEGESGQDEAGKNGGADAKTSLRDMVGSAASFMRGTVAPAFKKGAESASVVMKAAADSATETFGAAKSAAEQYFARKKAEESPKGQSKFVELSSAVRGYKKFLVEEAGFSPEEADQAVQDRIGDILNSKQPNSRRWWA